MTAGIPDDGPPPVPEGRVDLYALDRALEAKEKELLEV